jgi:Mg/Co/Ni transporter MgtE
VLAIGAMNGALWGLLMGAVTLLLYRSPGLAAVMAAAMLLNMLVAAGVGVLCPMMLARMRRDPVMGSSILLTATTDSMGFLIFPRARHAAAAVAVRDGDQVVEGEVALTAALWTLSFQRLNTGESW